MEYTLGQILLLPYNNENLMNFFPCNGQTLQIMQYQALFSLYGNTYGGDGRTTFCLPNLNGNTPHPMMRYYTCMLGIYPERN